MITTSMPTINLYDVVQLGNGDEMIVTQIKPNRPANPFCGVLVNGQGAEYKFGPRNRPVFVRHAEQNHPALIAWRRRITTQPALVPGQTPGPDAQAVIFHLLEAVEAEDMAKAKILAAVIRTMGQFRKNTT